MRKTLSCQHFTTVTMLMRIRFEHGSRTSSLKCLDNARQCCNSVVNIVTLLGQCNTPYMFNRPINLCIEQETVEVFFS